MEHLEYEERRQRIAQVAVDVIARDGIDAATLRRIAAEVGCSTTIITDCFEDKNELLRCGYQIVSAETLTQFEQRIAANPDDIVETLTSLSAVDERSWRGWRLYIAFLESALRDPVLASEQQFCIDTAHEFVERGIRAAYGGGGDICGAAKLVIALIRGVSVQVLFEHDSWSREQVNELLSRQIEMALGRGPLSARQPRKAASRYAVSRSELTS
jgi:TetR/AcrR family transcriptional regulator, transcriptional repressor of bet genes